MSPALAAETVGVMGSGTNEHDDVARPVGALLATLGVNLLTGGGGGVMLAVSRAYVRHRRGPGIAIGILPCASETERGTPPPGYPNEFVELAIRTHLPYSGERGTDDLSRNHLNVLSCAAILILPGGAGTASEASLALAYGRPVIAYAPAAEPMPHLPAPVRRTDDIDEVRQFLRRHLSA